MQKVIRKLKRPLNLRSVLLSPNRSSRLHAPQISCHVLYHGTEYSVWMVCTENLSEESFVYSFGVGDDASFNLDMIETYGAQIFAIDGR